MTNNRAAQIDINSAISTIATQTYETMATPNAGTASDRFSGHGFSGNDRFSGQNPSLVLL